MKIVLLATAITIVMSPPILASDGITLNDGGVTKLNVYVRDTGVNFIGVGQDVFPVSLPFSGNNVAVQGDSRAEAQYTLTDSRFSMTSSGARPGLIDSRSTLQPQIFFSVPVDTQYSITGSLVVDDLGDTARGDVLGATLQDVDTSAVLFHSRQTSTDVVDESFVLGGMAGNGDNERSGSPTGILLANHRYSFAYDSTIYAHYSGEPASFVGSFDVRLNAVPDGGASAPLLLGSLLGLIFLRRPLTFSRIQAR